MGRPMAPAVYVTEDGLVGHQMEGEALGPVKVGPPSGGGVKLLEGGAW